MRKPIFIILFPNKGNVLEEIRMLLDDLEEKFKEQYWIICAPTNRDDYEFKCFHDENFEQSNFEEIIKFVQDNTK